MRLRPWRADEAAWYVAARDGEILRWTTEEEALTEAEAQAAFARREQHPDVAQFAIAGPGDDAPLGNLSVTVDGSVARVAYWLAPAARGRGLVAEALELAVGWAASVGCTAAELEIHADNDASRRVAERAGFALAGERASDLPCAGPDGRLDVHRRRLDGPDRTDAPAGG